ncbi:hypothetical protein JXM83_02340 [Candidatus Woesearchaeota archaeon]|nr:hypothetical protein [Candidatus Woesearchaeota archaeon]
MDELSLQKMIRVRSTNINSQSVKSFFDILTAYLDAKGTMSDITFKYLSDYIGKILNSCTSLENNTRVKNDTLKMWKDVFEYKKRIEKTRRMYADDAKSVGNKLFTLLEYAA